MQPHWPLTLYHDGDCPLCAREIAWLKRNANPARLQLTDISSADFDPAALDCSLPQLQNLLHGRFADGHWVTGLDATYWSWTAAGHTWLARPLGWRWLRPTLDGLYRLFCRLRPALTWLPHPDGSRRCQDGACQIDKKQTETIQKYKPRTIKPRPQKQQNPYKPSIYATTGDLTGLPTQHAWLYKFKLWYRFIRNRT